MWNKDEVQGKAEEARARPSRQQASNLNDEALKSEG